MKRNGNTKPARNAWKFIGRGQLLLMTRNMRALCGVPRELCETAALRAYFRVS